MYLIELTFVCNPKNPQNLALKNKLSTNYLTVLLKSCVKRFVFEKWRKYDHWSFIRIRMCNAKLNVLYNRERWKLSKWDNNIIKKHIMKTFKCTRTKEFNSQLNSPVHWRKYFIRYKLLFVTFECENLFRKM